MRRNYCPPPLSILYIKVQGRVVAATLGKPFTGKPISGSAIARELGQDVRPVRSWLNHAETLGIVAQTETRRGWIPVAS